MRLFLLFLLVFYSIPSASGQKRSATEKQKAAGIRPPVDVDYKKWSRRRWETPVEFPSCDTGWTHYLNQAIDAYLPKRNGAPPGIYLVEVYFVILKDGSIETVSATTKFGFGMEEELCRVIRQSSKWRPATQNGRKVSYRIKQTFRFLVSDSLIT